MYQPVDECRPVPSPARPHLAARAGLVVSGWEPDDAEPVLGRGVVLLAVVAVPDVRLMPPAALDLDEQVLEREVKVRPPLALAVVPVLALVRQPQVVQGLG